MRRRIPWTRISGFPELLRGQFLADDPIPVVRTSLTGPLTGPEANTAKDERPDAEEDDPGHRHAVVGAMDRHGIQKRGSAVRLRRREREPVREGPPNARRGVEPAVHERVILEGTADEERPHIGGRERTKLLPSQADTDPRGGPQQANPIDVCPGQEGRSHVTWGIRT